MNIIFINGGNFSMNVSENEIESRGTLAIPRNLILLEPTKLASFLDQVGCNNANHIRHICIYFPPISNLGRHDVTLGDNSIRILVKIQSSCTNLSMPTTSLVSTNAIAHELDALDSPQVIVEALALVDAHFRAILSIQKIIAEVDIAS
jgi:hypothetical protein